MIRGAVVGLVLGSLVMLPARAQPSPGAIQVRRVERSGAPVLAGSCFQVWVDAGNGTRGPYRDAACDLDDGAEDGTTTIDQLPPGDYVLEEAVAPEGHPPAPDTRLAVAAGRVTAVTLTDRGASLSPGTPIPLTTVGPPGTAVDPTETSSPGEIVGVPTAVVDPDDGTVEVPTPDDLATATAAQDYAATTPPEYALLGHVLTYVRDDQFMVYPNPRGDRDQGLPVGDFVAEAVFANPPMERWDYGFLFGPAARGAYYHLYVRSDGRWSLDLGSATLATGEVEGLNVAVGASNKVRIVVVGARASFFVNNAYVAALEVPGRAASGKLWLATGALEGEEIGFTALAVWPLAAARPE